MNKIIMLPTDGNGVISLCSKILLIQNDELNYHNNQHLYILSDDEIKEFDWFLTFDVVGRPANICHASELRANGLMYDRVTDNCYNFTVENSSKKIIASTDKTLNLPEPSQKFIEYYVKAHNDGTPITEVNVEYKEYTVDGIVWFQESPYSIKHTKKRLKVNTDNTITIKRVKDSWNRKEVEELCTKAFRTQFGTGKYGIEKWIKENLI